MQFFYTRHQTPRGARADAETENRIYLIKYASHLRLTYQIRMLTYMARTRQKKLIIRLPEGTRIHESLRDFIHDNSELVSFGRT